jgi:RNA-binding protein 15
VIHYLDNDEKDATRTLFVGNLDNEITEDYLRSKFKSFGYIDSIDIKRDQLHVNSTVKRAYAFIKYENMLMAIHAKLRINGNSLLNGIKCKIGFGKLTPLN